MSPVKLEVTTSKPGTRLAFIEFPVIVPVKFVVSTDMPPTWLPPSPWLPFAVFPEITPENESVFEMKMPETRLLLVTLLPTVAETVLVPERLIPVKILDSARFPIIVPSKVCVAVG